MSSKNNEKKINIWKSYRYIFNLLFTKQKVLSIVLALLTLLLGLIAPGYIWLTGLFVDKVEKFLAGGSIDPLMITIVFFLALVLIQQLLNLSSDIVKSYLRERISFDLQLMFMNKAASMDISFFEHHESYEKMHRANKVFGNKIINTFQDFLNLFSWIISVIGYMAILLSVHFIVCILILSVIVPSFILKIRRSYHKYIVNYDDITPIDRQKSYYESLLTDVEVLKERKNYGLFDVFYERWAKLQTKVSQLILSNVFKEIRTSFVVDLLQMISYALTLFVLCFSIVFGNISAAAFVMMSQTILRLQTDAGEIVDTARSVYEQGLHFNDLTEFLEHEDVTEKQRHASVSAFQSINEQIRFDNVSFKYPNSDSWALKNVSFTVNKGETIAIIGMNGSGKTTLVKLLASLYEPTSGDIYFDDINTKQLSSKQMRDQISVIFQNHTNFKLTLRESIGLGDLARIDDLDHITNAANRCDLEEVAGSLPFGYETYLGKEFGGTELSGGQWQKVAFARCLMKQSPVVILDEPTSALDPIAEMKMLQQFKDLTLDRTTFLISHRIGSAKLADRILVLHKGRLVEFGTHEQLMHERGHYYNLFSMQSKWYEDVGETAI